MTQQQGPSDSAGLVTSIPDETLSEASFIGNVRKKGTAYERDVTEVQAKIALRLLWIFAGTIAGALILFAASRWLGIDTRDVREMSQALLALEATLLGSAVGFYYGERRK